MTSVILDKIGTTGVPPQPTSIEPITCTLEVITPMFVAGADNRTLERGGRDRPDIPGVTPEAILIEGIRSASVKAALRFWWRAGQKDLSDEGRIFGHAADGEESSQGCLVRTETVNLQNATKIEGVFDSKKYPELSYLAYGCADLQGATRPALMPQTKAKIQIIPHNPNDRKPIEDALERWLLFGNLGAKSRRGWGSLSDNRWKTVDELTRTIKRHLESANRDKTNHLSEWSSLSGARCLYTPAMENWADLLNEMGKVFHQFRKDLGADIKNFRADPGSKDRYRQDPGKDHNRVANWLQNKSMSDSSRGENGNILPDRCGFGLPHPMQFKNLGKLTFEPDGGDVGDRRASPVIFKVHKINNRFHGLITILGGRFLPEGIKVKAEEKRLRKNLSLPIKPRPQVLDDFSTYLLQNAFSEIK